MFPAKVLACKGFYEDTKQYKVQLLFHVTRRVSFNETEALF